MRVVRNTGLSTRERHDGVEKEQIPEATPIALAADERHRAALLLRLVVSWSTRSPLPGQPPQPIYMDTTRLCSRSYRQGGYSTSARRHFSVPRYKGLLRADATNDDRKTGARDVPGSLFV
jgi:hypothetical protein